MFGRGSYDEPIAACCPDWQELAVDLDLIGRRLDAAIDQEVVAGLLVDFPESLCRLAREVVPVEVAIQERPHVPEPLVVDVAYVDADLLHDSLRQGWAAVPVQ